MAATKKSDEVKAMAKQVGVTILIPEDIEVSTETGLNTPPATRTLGFVRDWIVRTVLNDKTWGESMDAMFKGAEIRGYFSGKEPGEEVTIPQGHYDSLLKALSNPSNPYYPEVAYQVLPFFDAIKNPHSKKA